jgi:hypothetical protein
MANLENVWTKDPDAVLDWSFDWTAWLNTPAESISTSTFSATPGIVLGTTSNTPTGATVWLSGGSDGRPYTVTNQIVTSQGRTDNRSVTIRVQNR